MVRATSTSTRSAASGHRLKLQIGSNTYSLGRERAISLAHAILKTKKYDLAARICEFVLGWDADDKEPAILLACCKAGLQDYTACNCILQASFAGDKQCVVEHLQAALVFDNLGMTPDAVTELAAATDEDPDLPMIWLLLGDEFVALGDRRKAGLCWRMAIDRDVHGGPIALAAWRQLKRAESG